MTQTPAPRWSLDALFPSLDAETYLASKAEVKTRLGALAEKVAAPLEAEALAPLLADLNALLEDLMLLYSYTHLLISVDAFDERAQAEGSSLEPLNSQVELIFKRLTRFIGGLGLEPLLETSTYLHAHRYFLDKAQREAAHLLDDSSEALLATLDMSGGGLWAKLRSDLNSRTTTPAEIPGQAPKDYGLAELRNLQNSQDPTTRRAAFAAELKLLEAHSLAYAGAMNGVKGQVLEVSKKRGFTSPLAQSLSDIDLTPKALNAMQEACREAFPVFRRYLRAKARLLGKDKLAWFDIMAPLPVAGARTFSWDEAVTFIVDAFDSYAPRLAAFAERSFAENWHDALPRRGKGTGAYCMPLHKIKASRIMSNFGGTLDDVFTLAHELGHAYHNDCIYRAQRSDLQADMPMTLAETASIFCETIATNSMLANTQGENHLLILEQDLLGATQLVLDIDSRFLFEQAVFEKRAARSLSVEELNTLMLQAQNATYGDILDPEFRHPLMWAQKPHYYSSRTSYYNFPYTFGYLFGLGLYAYYQAHPEGWHDAYEQLLSETGMASAKDLAARFDIDIEEKSFWQRSLAIPCARVEAYEAAVAKAL